MSFSPSGTPQLTANYPNLNTSDQLGSRLVDKRHHVHGVVKEMLYADDLALVGDNGEKVESRNTRWKKTLQDRGIKINCI